MRVLKAEDLRWIAGGYDSSSQTSWSTWSSFVTTDYDQSQVDAFLNEHQSMWDDSSTFNPADWEVQAVNPDLFDLGNELSDHGYANISLPDLYDPTSWGNIGYDGWDFSAKGENGNISEYQLSHTEADGSAIFINFEPEASFGPGTAGAPADTGPLVTLSFKN